MEVDTHPIPPVHIPLFEPQNPTHTQKSQADAGLHDCFSDIFFIVIDPLNDMIEPFNLSFVFDFDGLELLYFFVVRFDQLGYFDVILELQEGPANDVLWIHILEPLTVDHHIDVDIEAGEQVVAVPFEHIFGDFGLHLLINHEYGDSLLIEPSPPCSATHLNVLSAAHPPKLLSVELPHGSKHHSFCRHVQTHREGLGREQALKKAFLEEDFDHLLDEREEAAVVDPDPLL